MNSVRVHMPTVLPQAISDCTCSAHVLNASSRKKYKKNFYASVRCSPYTRLFQSILEPKVSAPLGPPRGWRMAHDETSYNHCDHLQAENEDSGYLNTTGGLTHAKRHLENTEKSQGPRDGC